MVPLHFRKCNQIFETAPGYWKLY